MKPTLLAWPPPAHWIDRALADGVLRLSGVPLDRDNGALRALAAQLGRPALRALAHRAGLVEPGGVQRVEWLGDSPLDQAGKTLLSASNGEFPLHTDESFELQPARWVLLHCWRPSATGGETRLADSRLVAARAERSLRIALSQWRLPYPCGDMTTLAADLRVRFNRAECELAARRRNWPPGPALTLWLDRFEQAFEQVADRCRLNSGDLLIIDNWRVLHGRCAFPADSGRQLKRLRVLQDRSGQALASR